MAKKRDVVILAFLFLILFSVSVYAQEEGVLQSVFGAIAGQNFDMAGIYEQYGSFIDFTIYLIVFISIAKMTLGKTFHEKGGGTALSVAVGVALAVGLSVWARTAGFSIASFGWVAAAVFLLIVMWALYHILKMIIGEANFTATSLRFLIPLVITWYIARAISPPLIEMITKIPVIGGLIESFIGIALLITLILGVIEILNKLSGGKRLVGAGSIGRSAGETIEKAGGVMGLGRGVKGAAGRFWGEIEKEKKEAGKIPATVAEGMELVRGVFADVKEIKNHDNGVIEQLNKLKDGGVINLYIGWLEKLKKYEEGVGRYIEGLGDIAEKNVKYVLGKFNIGGQLNKVVTKVYKNEEKLIQNLRSENPRLAEKLRIDVSRVVQAYMGVTNGTKEIKSLARRIKKEQEKFIKNLDSAVRSKDMKHIIEMIRIKEEEQTILDRIIGIDRTLIEEYRIIGDFAIELNRVLGEIEAEEKAGARVG